MTNQKYNAQKLLEGNNIEIKKAKNSFPIDALKTYSAFCNSDGGTLILGIDEKIVDNSSCFDFIGVENPNKVIDNMFSILNNPKNVNRNILSNKNIKIETIEEKNIIFITIPNVPYTQKPIYLKNNLSETYKRNNTGDYKCTEEEIASMVRDSVPTPQDLTILNDFDYLKALDDETITKYRNTFSSFNPAHPFNNYDNEQFLSKLGAISFDKDNYYPTIAGLIVFGNTEYLLRALPYFWLEYIDYGYESSERWIDRIVYDGTWGEGNIFNFFYLAMNKLKNTLPNKFNLDKNSLIRKDNSDLYEAFREALVNCLIHSDYKSENKIIIRHSNNIYEFSNPGTLRIPIKDYYAGKSSSPRNPTIAKLLRFIGLVEESGSGVPKILEAARNNKLSNPNLSVENDKVILTINTTPEIDYIISKFKLNKNEINVLKAINSKFALKRNEIEEITGLSRKKTLYILNNLINKGIIVRNGNTRSLKYSISNEHISNENQLILVLENTINFLKSMANEKNSNS